MTDFDSNKIFENEEFRSLDKSNQDITGKEFENCEFANCNFSGSEFSDCKFVDCKFENCNFSVAKLNEVSLIDTSFKECSLKGIDFSRLTGFSTSPDFKECILNYTTFTGMDLSGRKFYKCKLLEASFIEVDLKSADFSYADLKSTQFDGCELNNANLVGAKNYFIDLKKNKATDAKFSLPEAVALLKNFDIKIEE